MTVLRSFKGFRPKKEFASKIASKPYDVLSSEEARESAKDNPYSFLHVVKPEIDLPQDVDVHSQQVYDKGKENLSALISDGILSQDKENYLYIYAQTMWSKTQYGLVGCAHIEDYLNKKIKEHELTRPDKELDRINHIRNTDFNAEPVFFAYKDNEEINKIVASVIKADPEYNFMKDDVQHQLWIIKDQTIIKKIEDEFQNNIECTYVADGHHRTAAAAKVGLERKEKNAKHNGNEEYNYFLAVHFPASQLRIIDYNRLIKDLNGLKTADFIEELKESFKVELVGSEEYKPTRLHEFSLYIDKYWYKLEAKEGTYTDDPINCLDVTILTKYVLDPILNIVDLRKSTRIDFVGGIRGLGELKNRVDSGEMAAAFALYPVSMQQLINIADSGNIMPPKTTWFVPKLESGLVLHKITED